jgi:hypothetical protein
MHDVHTHSLAAAATGLALSGVMLTCHKGIRRINTPDYIPEPLTDVLGYIFRLMTCLESILGIKVGAEPPIRYAGRIGKR